jgi:hypothetical protein
MRVSKEQASNSTIGDHGIDLWYRVETLQREVDYEYRVIVFQKAPETRTCGNST